MSCGAEPGRERAVSRTHLIGLPSGGELGGSLAPLVCLCAVVEHLVPQRHQLADRRLHCPQRLLPLQTLQPCLVLRDTQLALEGRRVCTEPETLASQLRVVPRALLHRRRMHRQQRLPLCCLALCKLRDLFAGTGAAADDFVALCGESRLLLKQGLLARLPALLRCTPTFVIRCARTLLLLAVLVSHFRHAALERALHVGSEPLAHLVLDAAHLVIHRPEDGGSLRRIDCQRHDLLLTQTSAGFEERIVSCAVV